MIITGKYPNLRLRRNRKTDWSRRLVRENSLSANDLILPIFIIEGKNKKESIRSMPNVYRYSVDKIPLILDKAVQYKIPMVAFLCNVLLALLVMLISVILNLLVK